MAVGTKKIKAAENLDAVVLNQIAAPIFAVDEDFNFLFLNAEGRRWGEGASTAKKCYEMFNTTICQTDKCPLKQAMERNKVCSGQTEARRGREMVPVEFTANALKNEQGRVIGGVEFIVDITERLEAEAKARQLHEDMLELSTPVLSVWDKIMVVPLIGTLDSRRTQDAMEKALNKMAEEKTQILIVDITGVPTVDTMVANHLIRLAMAVSLMGGTAILTGISPITAKTIVHLGIDLSKVKTCATLAQGLRLAIKIVDKGDKK